MSPIKVMVVDDSAVARQVVVGLLRDDPGVEVIAAVSDPLFAMQKMQTQWPDVILLDVEMPRMDGITFLKQIMTERPTPVIICSTLTEAGAPTTLATSSASSASRSSNWSRSRGRSRARRASSSWTSRRPR